MRWPGIVVLAAAGVFFAIEYGMPIAASYVWKEDYKRLVFACDHAMRDHFVAKQLMVAKPSDMAVRNLKAAEVGLSQCHDYDKLRKRLRKLGVSDSRLAEIGLEAVEEKAKDIRKFVETHEIRY
jgi:hypothetical protein